MSGLTQVNRMLQFGLCLRVEGGSRMDSVETRSSSRVLLSSLCGAQVRDIEAADVEGMVSTHAICLRPFTLLELVRLSDT